MKAYELPIKLNEQGMFDVPQALKQVLESGLAAKLFVLVEEEEDEEGGWAQLAAEAFFADDDGADDIYYQHYLESKLEKVSS